MGASTSMTCSSTRGRVCRKSAIVLNRVHVVGHSMGVLTALLLAQQEPHRVLSFVDIENSLAPEERFMSRQIVTHPGDDDERFFDGRRARTPLSRVRECLYAASLRHKVRSGAVRGICGSMGRPLRPRRPAHELPRAAIPPACSCTARRTRP